MPNKDKKEGLDKTQFEKLFREHFVHLASFARQYIEDEDSAKDIAQKVFINLWENRAKIDSEKSIASYLFTSVKNRCLNHIRDHKKFRSNLLDLECNDFDLSVAPDQGELTELEHHISVALASLPEKCRRVFEMSRYHDKKYKEIAEELAISQKTVEAHMSKAIKALRVHLQDYLGLILLVYYLSDLF
jgi:RNA polymerase sigma-70 factor (ECF subfamily)